MASIVNILAEIPIFYIYDPVNLIACQVHDVAGKMLVYTTLQLFLAAWKVM